MGRECLLRKRNGRAALASLMGCDTQRTDPRAEEELLVRGWQKTVAVGVSGAALVVAAVAPAAFAASGPVSSSLASGKLNTSIWHVLNQDSGLSPTAHAGWLTLPTETALAASFGQAHDVVLQPVASPSENWTVSVETTFFGKNFGPAGTLPNFQSGGIYAWQNGSNWVRMIRQPSNCTLAIQIDDGTWGSQTGLLTASGQPMPSGAAHENGVAGTPAYGVACNNSDDPLWIRLSKQGNLYTGYYSTNGTTWVETQSWQDPVLQVADVGINANEGGGTAPPSQMGFKDFTVSGVTGAPAAPTTTSSTASSSTAASSTASSSTAATSSSATSGSVPKTGGGPGVPLLGGALVAAGIALASGRRRARFSRH